MERTGGEPDVVGYDEKSGEIVFVDCSTETPKGRLNVCYDSEGQAEREKHGVHPAGKAVDRAAEMGIELLTEEQYRSLQRLGEFDTKTSSWIKTPQDIRKLGGATFRRPTLQPRLRIPQQRTYILQHKSVPRYAKNLNLVLLIKKS